MKVCILCEDSVVSEVRKTASFILSTDVGFITVTIDVILTPSRTCVNWC